MSSIEALERYRPVDVRRAARPRPATQAVPAEDSARPLPPAPAPRSSGRIEQPAAAKPKTETKPETKAGAKAEAQTPIIPAHSISGNALLAVIAIMSFLAAMTLGAAVMVKSAAAEWQGQVARELTIQIRPAQGRDLDWEVGKAVEIARTTAGVAQVRPYTREESAGLLEPWLGSGLSLDELPVPRLIVISMTPGAEVDVPQLRQRLASEIGGASLDDHRAFVERMRAMTRGAVVTGMAVLGLMLAATILLVFFATRGAMAANHAIVEVLHFVGAKNRFIAGQFQRHFLMVGLKGAALGGSLAILIFLAGRFGGGSLAGKTGTPEIEALAGSFALGADGFAGIVGVLVLVAAVTALTSRMTVHRTLDALE